MCISVCFVHFLGLYRYEYRSVSCMLYLCVSVNVMVPPCRKNYRIRLSEQTVCPDVPWFMLYNVITAMGSSSLTTRRAVFALRSLVWGFGESCAVVHDITSAPENVLSLTLSSTSKHLAAIWTGDFDPQLLRSREMWCVDSPPIGSYWWASYSIWNEYACSYWLLPPKSTNQFSLALYSTI